MVVYMITVDFLYVDDEGQTYRQSLLFDKDICLGDAIDLTGWLDLPKFNPIKIWFDGVDDKTPIDQKAWYVGVFSVKKPLNYLLQDGDRVEFYRPLPDDPMKKRKDGIKNAKKKKARLATHSSILS